MANSTGFYCAFNTFWRCPDEAITKGIKPCWACPIAIKPEEVDDDATD